MDRFLQSTDDISELINRSATSLYNDLAKLDFATLQIPDECRYYLQASHLSRLFFSLETSAHLLKRAIDKRGQPIENIILMDYGAGVGTLYLLAKKIGCKKVIYNDHLESWKISAKVIAESCGVFVDEYIVGDIGSTMKQLAEKELICDIITSRNVVEHIYNLKQFFQCIHEQCPTALIYNSTTANYANPASLIKHFLWHKKCEKTYHADRKEIISSLGVPNNEIDKLVRATRGLAMEDLTTAVETFKKTRNLPNPSPYGTNTCDPKTGVWAEHLIRYSTYKDLSNEFRITIEPGFWDTHYKSALKRLLGIAMNKIGSINKVLAFRTAPFIYIIAEPIGQKTGL